MNVWVGLNADNMPAWLRTMWIPAVISIKAGAGKGYRE